MTKSQLTVLGAVLTVSGLVAFIYGFAVSGLFPLVLLEWASVAIGSGPFLETLGALGSTVMADAQRSSYLLMLDPSGVEAAQRAVAGGMVAWIGGWVALASGVEAKEPPKRVDVIRFVVRSAINLIGAAFAIGVVVVWGLRGAGQVGWGVMAVVTLFGSALAALAWFGSSKLAAKEAPVTSRLYPRLANATDFHWGTLAAYGFGLLLAELVFIGVYLLLVGKSSGTGTVTGGLAPVYAFIWAFAAALVTAFGAGFLGSANSKRLSIPELTIAILYLGLPVPIFLTAMHHVSSLMLNIGYRLRELVYLASLLGENRPEIGYWLITAGLALFAFLGINLGFVATSSGRFDLKASYESFIASRHVAVFRPWLLIGCFLVLLTGIVAPLILLAIVIAADRAVSRTRVKRLGLLDPLRAAAALDEEKRAEMSPTTLMTAISIIGVGFGVMALIIVLSVMSGFEADLQKKILGTNSHGVVMKYTPEMAEYAEVMEKIHQVKGVTGATPFILNEVMVSSEGNISGSMIKGIDPATVGTVTDLASSLGCKPEEPCQPLDALDDPTKIRAKRLETLPGAGALDEKPAGGDGALEKTPEIIRDPLIEMEAAKPEVPSTLPGIVVGKELAASLKVVVGDRINVVSPLGGELGPQGPVPKSRPFRVAGIFYSGMFEYDSKFVYIHLREAQSFFGVKGASGVEIKVDDVDNARGIMKRIYDNLEGYPYRTKDWGEMNRNLFAALRLEKLVMAIILTTLVILAGVVIVATVIMLVLEKRKEIAVLKALGVPDGGVVKIFLAEGLQIGVAGGLLGLVSGLAWCLFIEKVGIKLDPQVYYIPSLPVRIVPLQTILAVVIAILVTFLASVYPALKASQVEPVEGLKSE